MPLSPEFLQFTTENPVLFSDWDSDLEQEGLLAAKHKFEKRWDNTQLFANQSEILSPVVADEMQKAMLNTKISQKERGEIYARNGLSPDITSTLIIDNSNPIDLARALQVPLTEDNNKLFLDISEKLKLEGLNITPEEAQKYLLTRYVKDSMALHNVEGKYGIIGNFGATVGNFAWDQVTDPLNFILDGISIAAGGALGSLVKSGIVRAGSVILGEATGLATKQLAFNALIANERRRDIGLPEIPLAKTFGFDVLAGATLGTAFPLAFAGGAKLIKSIGTAFNKPMFQRTVELIQNSKLRMRNAVEKSDAVLAKEGNDAAKTVVPFEGIKTRQIELNPDFPRVSDPSIKPTNRAFINSIGIAMQDTSFIEDTRGFFAEKMVSYTSKMSEPELFILSENMAKARTYQDFYPSFLESLKTAESKESFVKKLKDNLFDEKTKTIKEYVTRNHENIVTSDAETYRNQIAHAALHNNVFEVLEKAGLEHESTLDHEFLLKENAFNFSQENPWKLAQDEEGLRFASDWERLKNRAKAVNGDIYGDTKFTPKEMLWGRISELQNYSSTLAGLRAEFLNEVLPEIKGLEMQDLLNAFSDKIASGEANKVKATLAKIKARRRAIAKEYGIEYGEIADHIPQAWNSEAIRTAGLEQFQNDFLPHIDIEKTKDAYHTNTRQFLYEAEKELDRLLKDFDKKTKQRSQKYEERINTTKKIAADTQKRTDRLFTKVLKSSEIQQKEALKYGARLKNKLDAISTLQRRNINLEQATEETRFLNKKLEVLNERSKRYNETFKANQRKLKVLKDNLQKERDTILNYNQLRQALSIVDIFNQRDVAKNVLNISDSAQISQNAIKTNQVRVYNYLKRFKLVPERKNNKTFLSSDDFDRAMRATSRLPEELTAAKFRALNYLNNRNKIRTIEAETRALKRQAQAELAIANKVESVENKFRKQYVNAIKRSLSSRQAKEIQSEEAKLQIALGKKLDVADQRNEIEELFKLSKEYERVIKQDAKQELSELRAAFKEELQETLKSIESNDIAIGMQKIQERLKKQQDKQIDDFIEFTKRTDTVAEKAKNKAMASIERIQQRNITNPIERAFNRIEELKEMLKKPFGQDEMRQIFNNITTEDLTSASSATPSPNIKGSKQRILYFKDVNAFERLNRKYGKAPDFRVLVARDLDSNLRDIARLRAFNGSKQFFEEELERDFKFLIGNRNLGFWESQLKKIADANIKYVSGSNPIDTSTLSAYGKLYQSIIRMSALGGAGLTTLFDDANSIAFSASQNGFGFFRTLGHYIQGITKADLSPSESSRLLSALEDLEINFEQEILSATTNPRAKETLQTAQAIDRFTFKINGVQWLTDRGRVVFNKFFLRELGSLGSELNTKFKNVLSQYGINAKEISEIIKLGVDDEGIPIFDEAFKLGNTYTKILRALHTESRKAIAQTSQSLKAVMASEGTGGFMLGMVNSLFFLKRIPMQVWFDRFLIPIMRGQYGEGAKFFAQNLMFNTARLTLKYLAMGYAPDFTDPAFYREVLLQNASMMPMLQPLFSMDRVDRFNVEHAVGRSFLGVYSPIVDAGQLVADLFSEDTKTKKQHKLSKDALRIVKDFTPLKTHPALGLLYERMLFDNMLLAADPQAHRTLAEAEEVRRKSGKIKVF